MRPEVSAKPKTDMIHWMIIEWWLRMSLNSVRMKRVLSILTLNRMLCLKLHPNNVRSICVGFYISSYAIVYSYFRRSHKHSSESLSVRPGTVMSSHPGLTPVSLPLYYRSINNLNAFSLMQLTVDRGIEGPNRLAYQTYVHRLNITVQCNRRTNI